MTPSRPDLSLSRLELIILARLSSGKSDDAALTSVVRELTKPDEQTSPEQAATQTLSQLRRRGLVSEPTKRARSNRTLTDQGVRALRAGFGLDESPTWKDARNTHLIACALGLSPGSDVAQRATENANTLATMIVRNHYKVTKPSAVADKLLREALGLPPGPVTLAGLRAHMLAKHFGIPSKLDAKQVAIKLAAVVLGQTKGETNKKTMGQALIRRWVYEATSTQAASTSRGVVPPSPAKPSTPQQNLSLDKPRPLEPQGAATLLDVVREAIPRVGADGRFGPEKVFVSALWRRIEQDTRLTDLSFDRFKRWLVTANRDQLIDLARADIVGAMDPKLVADSEIRDLGATFHFVVDRRVNGARGVHAR